jgi:hypothetical protein
MAKMTRALIVTCISIFLSSTAAFAQSDQNPLVKKAMDAAVTILTGTGAGITDKIGSGIIVRSDGIILTAYHVVKDASQLQIRLRNGEIYDKVDLLGYDERRDVAALRIPATNLTVADIRSEDASAGDKVFVISSPQALTWTIADGSLSAIRMADDVPGAGRGYKVIQFSASVSSGSSGGLLVDSNGKALGLIVGTLSSGQSLNFAIPLTTVNGLANAQQSISSFSRGTSLELPQAVRPPVNADLMNADPHSILRGAKFIYIWGYSDFINEQMMENALMKLPEFEKWKLIIVKDEKLADIKVNIEHDLFTWNYRYSVTDKRTDILLASGKVTAWDGRIASGKFAREIIEKLRPGREQGSPDKKDKTDPKKDAEKKKTT